LEATPSNAAAKMLPEDVNTGSINPQVPVALSRLEWHFHPFPDRTAHTNIEDSFSMCMALRSKQKMLAAPGTGVK